MSCAAVQRGLKEQPLGSRRRFGGRPLMAKSSWPFWSRRGIESSRPRVYGCADDAEVVGDQDQTHVQLALELGQQVHHLGLDGHVESRGRLVGDDQVRLQRDRHGDHDALTHTAREVVRVVVHALRGGRDLDLVHQLDGLEPGFLLRRTLVDAEHLAQLVADAEHRVEGGQRVLEDHGDLPAAELAPLLEAHLQHVLAAEEDLALRDLAGRHVEDAHDGLGGDRLAGARLAEHGEGLARAHAVVDAVDCLGHAVAGVELHVEVAHFEERALLVPVTRGGNRTGVVHGDHLRPPQRSFGSRALRTASPSMMKARTVMLSMIEG